MDKQLMKLSNYVEKSENSFVSEIWDYIEDKAIDYTELTDCIDDALNDPNGLFLTDDEYVDLYDKFEDEILACVNGDDFSNLFKNLPTVREYKIILTKYAIECVLNNFIDVIKE